MGPVTKIEDVRPDKPQLHNLTQRTVDRIRLGPFFQNRRAEAGGDEVVRPETRAVVRS